MYQRTLFFILFLLFYLYLSFVMLLSACSLSSGIFKYKFIFCPIEWKKGYTSGRFRWVFLEKGMSIYRGTFKNRTTKIHISWRLFYIWRGVCLMQNKSVADSSYMWLLNAVRCHEGDSRNTIALHWTANCRSL